jgi:competence protein ComEC
MIGLQPSAVRAGVMGGMLLLGEKLGRQSGGFRPVVIVASLMLLANPFLLMKDVGFQLSFLAVTGIMYLGPVFRRWLGFLLRDKVVGLKTILATTLSAQIFTLPILVYNFGKISLAAPAANILILPIVSWIMIFGFLLVIAGFVFGFFAWFFSIPCWFLLTYLIWVVDFFSKPWASKIIEDVHWSWLVVSYSIIGAGSFWLARKDRLKFLNY